ncbi:MAG: protein phosphatase 2C domain-containing protein [Candidatus Latescibacterota bacterium]|jgi:protein phosphatase
MLNIEAGYCSNQGDRERNEDRAEILGGGRVCLVADGMGGMQGGEVASSLAVETVQRLLGAGLLATLEGEESVYQGLRQVFSEVNQRILVAGRDALELLGMGTTLTLLLIGEERLFFAHAGDSRLYLWQEGYSEQLTEDHTQAQEFVQRGWFSPEEAMRSRNRHLLTRYLGTAGPVEPQLGTRPVQAGTRLLMCSDGLYDKVGPERLNALLADDQPSEAVAGRLVATARGSGRTDLDNITALVVRLG